MKKTINGISVVLPYYNAERRIRDCLDCFLRQVDICFPIQFILVDNNSTDSSFLEVDKFISRAKIKDFDVVYAVEKRQGRLFAILKGLEFVKYEVVCHVDDDNYVCDDFFYNLYDFYCKNSIDAVGSLGCPQADDNKPLPTWFEDFKFSYAVGAPVDHENILDPKKDWLYGACFSYRTDIVKSLMSRGFDFVLIGRSGDRLLSGEDMELLLALFKREAKVVFNKKQKFIHCIPRSRLTKEYLIRLHFGFGLASPVIGLMRAHMDARSNMGTLLRRSYSLYVFVQFVRYFLFLIWPFKTLYWRCRTASLKGSIFDLTGGFARWRKCKNNIKLIS